MQWRQVASPIAVYALSTACVLFGVLIGIELHGSSSSLSFQTAVSRFDAGHYIDIVNNGYRYDPNERSTVAFFPAFPLLGWLAMSVLPVSSPMALMAVANVLLCVCLVLFWLYLQSREPKIATHDSLNTNALLAFALLPTTFFFRMPYSETSLLVLALLAMLGMARRWPLWSIALIIGACTATRPVGIALLVPFALHLAGRSDGYRQMLGRAIWLMPIACWGLAAYVVYQWSVFDEPLAFAKTQTHWRVRPTGNLLDKAIMLGSMEPIWATYVDIPTRGWEVLWPHALFSMNYVNPVYFLGTAGLLAFGHYKRWLNREEFWLGAILLLIPYVTRAPEWMMLSHARFAAVAFPVYIVLGQLLSRMPRALCTIVLCCSAAVMTMYAALFAVGRDFF